MAPASPRSPAPGLARAAATARCAGALVFALAAWQGAVRASLFLTTDSDSIDRNSVPSDSHLVTPLEVQANRFQLVSRLADDLAHEIKNPLHAMVINLELVKRRAQAGDIPTAIQRAEVVEAEVMRVNGLVDRLLDLLRPPKADPVVADIDAVVEDLLPLVTQQARLSGVELVYQGIGSPRGAGIRRDALKLVLLNLVANALERVRSSGGHVEVTALQDETGARILVTDSVAGSSLEDATTRLAASGGSSEAAQLGLAVVRHLLEESGGELLLGGGAPGEAAYTAVLRSVPAP